VPHNKSQLSFQPTSRVTIALCFLSDFWDIERQGLKSISLTIK